MQSKEENKENPAVAYLQQIILESEKEKSKNEELLEMVQFYRSRYEDLKKTATLAPAVYKFNIN